MLFRELCEEAKENAFRYLSKERPHLLLQMIVDKLSTMKGLSITIVNFKDGEEGKSNWTVSCGIEVISPMVLHNYISTEHPQVMKEFSKAFPDAIDDLGIFGSEENSKLSEKITEWFPKNSNLGDQITFPILNSAGKSFYALKDDYDTFRSVFEDAPFHFKMNGTPLVDEGE
jgi:hypothetical protein